MNVVSNLFSLIAENLINVSLQINFHKVTQKAVKFDATVSRSRQTTGSKTTGAEAEIASIFLNHHVGRDFRGSKKRVLRLINPTFFRSTVEKGFIFIVPSISQFSNFDLVWRITVNLVRRQVNE